MTNNNTSLVVVRPQGRANNVTVKQTARLVVQAHKTQDQFYEALKKAAVACVHISKREADGGFSDCNQAKLLVQGLRHREDQRALVEYFNRVSNIRLKFSAKDATWSVKLDKEGSDTHKDMSQATDETLGDVDMDTPRDKKANKKATPTKKDGTAFKKSLGNLLKKYAESDELPDEYEEVLASLRRLVARADAINV